MGFESLLGALKGIGSGIGRGAEYVGKGIYTGVKNLGTDEEGHFDWGQLGNTVGTFGEGMRDADPESQLGQAAAGAGAGLRKIGQKKAYGRAQTAAEHLRTMERDAPVQEQPPNALPPASLTPHIPQPPTDDGNWAWDGVGWIRKPEAIPLRY
jgi:hypothetical protein